jgi:DNA-binding transcriptional MerR regulator
MRRTNQMSATARTAGKPEATLATSDWASISDVAKDFDVTLRTLRFYEARGLLSPRRDGMNRYYSEQDRARLTLILKGKKLGFTLAEIRTMVAQNPSGKGGLTLSLPQIDEQLTLLRNQFDECKAAIAELEERRAVLTGTRQN